MTGSLTPLAHSYEGVEAPSHDPHWYRQAVFYEVLLASYADANGDGVGDFAGLQSKLDYLAWLGIDAIWIPPFYPSPLRDGGYDISDYTAINPRYGTMEDFTALVGAAHERGIRVVIDMVLNHTSDEHPWFQASRSDPTGPYGDFYVWRDSDDDYRDARIIFIDTETSNWTKDPVRGQYFWHRFFSHQPDLNYDNPAVRAAIRNVVRFWCRTGVDAFRLDAIPYLYESNGTNCENLPATHEFIAELRAMVDEEFPGTVMIAEANQPPADVVDYFGTEATPECHICFHFPIMPRLFAALRAESGRGLRQILATLPPLPGGGQWGTFLRNHDELTLEMVDETERADMYRWYAPESRMRSNVGIRRRLAPLLGGSRRKIELAHAMLLSLPGSPFLYYGDEIGMGDNIWLPDRDGVRTPMQWDPTSGAGFSHADPESFLYPLIDAPGWDPRSTNVEESMARETSLLNWLRRALAVRRAYPCFGQGAMQLATTSREEVMAFIRRDETTTLLCVYNLAASAQAVSIDLPGMAGWHTRDIVDGGEFPRVSDADELTVTLTRHGYYWLELTCGGENSCH
ncbi:maltose alpha-D-glucosyltransferase [Nanchangia anserum]|uniref:maltose alpha-D-glucosyltransferase n=1 Tax=Nanchangia anserum TaxID=2692125 RepID=UPI001D126966|nr:maltose alpha-D-glucosyltransferase [Nanchangia anserum]